MGQQFMNEIIYKLAATGFATKLSELISYNFGLHQAINTLKSELEKDNTPERRQKLEKCLETATSNLFVNQFEINSVVQNITKLNEMFKEAFKNVPPLINAEQQEAIKAATISNNDDLVPTMQARLHEIKDAFAKAKEAADFYKKHPGLSEFKAYEAARKNFLSLRSTLSIRVNSAKKNDEISPEEFEKFREQQVELYKEQNRLHRSVTELKKSLEIKTTEDTKAKKQEIRQTEQDQKLAQQQLKQEKRQVKLEQQKIEVAVQKEKLERKKARLEKREQKRAAMREAMSTSPQRMAISKTAEKIVSKVNEHIPKAKEASHGQNVLESEMKKIDASMGTHNEEYQVRDIQKQEEVKKEAKEARKAGLKRNVDPELLRQRDHLAAEMSQMKRMYGTANNEEYQMRVDQLKELDKKIFGRKAKRVYKDLDKPISLIGGDFVELPKNYVEMRIQHIEEKSK